MLVASQSVDRSGTAPGLVPAPARGGSHSLERTLREVSHGLERTLSADETARLPGLLQRLDPRGKVVAFVALLLAASLVRQLPVLLGLCLLAHALPVLGRLPFGYFLRRVWVFVPLFSIIVAAPATLNAITPGPLVLELVDLGEPWRWGPFSLPATLGISERGLRAATTLVLRVATSVSLAVVLISTTPWVVLLKGLEALRLPRAFLLVLGMTYRYCVLFLRAVDAMFLARQSRHVGPLAAGQQRRLLAASGGALLGKTYHLANEVYLAMISRGFRGEFAFSARLTWRERDWLALAAALMVAAGALLLDRSL